MLPESKPNFDKILQAIGTSKGPNQKPPRYRTIMPAELQYRKPMADSRSQLDEPACHRKPEKHWQDPVGSDDGSRR
jgi:hypothetical protein